jgi:hypothetical protein
MRVPVMREVGAGAGFGIGAGMSGTVGLVPPLVPCAPLVPLIAQLIPVPGGGTSTEAQAAVRGMQAEWALLGQAQQRSGPGAEVTAESMAKVLLIEAECLRLRRDSADAAALRQEVMMLRTRLQEQEQVDPGVVESVEQGASTSYSDSHSYSANTP